MEAEISVLQIHINKRNHAKHLPLKNNNKNTPWVKNEKREMKRLVLPTPLGSFMEKIFLNAGYWGTVVVKIKKILTLLELTPMGNKNAHLSK